MRSPADESQGSAIWNAVRARPDQQPSAQTVQEYQEAQAILSVLIRGVLTGRQRDVLVGLYYQGRTAEDIAKRLNVNRQRVGQIRDVAIARIRTILVRAGVTSIREIL